MTLYRKLAFTLAEILVSIAVIGGISAGGYVVMRNVSQSSSQVKLEQDVRIVNNAIRTYEVNGGKLTAGISGDEALVKIRRQAADLRKNAGLKGSAIDPRMNLRYQTSGEGGKRAYWDPDERQFWIAESGDEPGVKEFYLGALPPPLPLITNADGTVTNPNLDDRQTYGTFAAVDSWVWDYDSNGSIPRSTPSNSITSNATISSSSGTIDQTIIVLSPPRFSIAGGRFDLSWYPRELTLTPAASTPAGVSDIYYIITGGQWQKYTAPIQINDPGQTVVAKSVALDLDHYSDSAEVMNNYSANQITLDLAHAIQPTYRYAELGGTLASGSLAPVLATVPRLFLANANDIPDNFERNDVFQSYWSWDGSSPDTASAGRYSGISSFTNGYPGEALVLNVGSFPTTSNTLTLKYAALSKNPEIAVSSPVESVTTSIATTPLLAPLVTPDSGSLSNGEVITMSLNVLGSATPANARIYYRTDGQDPGDVNGEPASGATLYTVPFSLDSFNSPTVRVVARVYPPAAYKRWFTTSPTATLNYYLPYAEENVYAVIGGTNQIFNINPSTGTNRIYDSNSTYNLRALALDTAKARIYYVEENGSSATGWRVGYHDFIGTTHKTLGNIKGTWSYNASVQPDNLAYFNGALYYIHANSDDLVRIALNDDASAIASVAKVADLRGNNAWSNIGDLAIDETGLLFFVDSGSRYHRFDLTTLSGYLQLSSVAQPYAGLAFYQSRLFSTRSDSNTINRLAPNTGSSLSSVAAANSRKFIDLASPTSATPVSTAKSMWGIVDQADGPHMVEFRNNYRSPLVSTAVDYGPILFEGSSLLSDTRYGILSLAVSNSGMAYFVRNSTIRKADGTGNSDSYRPLLSLNLANLRLGDTLNATHVGDLKPGLQTMAGSLDPDDVVTGISLSPNGELYGVLREGNSSGVDSADYIFKCTLPVSSLSGSDLGVTTIGRTTSAAGLSSNSEDLVFTRDGRLFVLDGYDNEILEVNPVTGVVLSVMSNDAGGYRALAVDPTDYRIVASNTGANTFNMVNGGPGNDETFLSYQDRWGYSNIEAISFYQAPFLLLNTQVDLFAVDGSKTIHGIDFATGQTVPVTDAPWPVRAVAYDLVRREVFYLRGGSSSFTLGSFNRDTFQHKIYGDLKDSRFERSPVLLPDNLMYFGGFLWYVEPQTDNLMRIEVGTNTITAQKKASNLNANILRFDLIGDLAMTPDGWVYFSCINFEGQRFCRYQINSLSQFEVLSGPIASPVLLPGGESYRENWFDALAFAPPDAGGNRALYSTYAVAPSPLHTVDTSTGGSTFYKNILPNLSLIDFSDYHPGTLSDPNAVTLRPLLKLNNLHSTYTYAEVGGPFLIGFVPPPAAVTGPTVVLNNPNELLLSQQNSDHFEVRWSTDGVDPRTSPNASVTGTFSNGFPGQQLSVAYSLWGTSATLPLQVVAKSLKTAVLVDSPMLSPVIAAQRMVLDNPLVTEVAAVNGVRQLEIKPNIAGGLVPPGVRIYYTTDGTDPGVTRDSNGLDNPTTGRLYTGTIALPNSVPNGQPDYIVNARVYPPTNLPQWFEASDYGYYSLEEISGIGHMDVDTSSQIYPYRRGKTDRHVHAYTRHYNTAGLDFFNLADNKLHEITDNVSSGMKFKIIVSNADLSPGGRIVINKTYNPSDPSTWIPVTTYDNTAPSALTIYSLDGAPGTTRLTSFGFYSDMTTIANGGLIQGNPGHVKNNTPGIYGEWRNGAFTIQVVRVNSSGYDAFTTNTTFSGGGVQGVATSGLLWECTVFHHGSGGPYSPN
ncbi:MAG: type II secretion system protein [Verrucomicrobiota bacterium]